MLETHLKHFTQQFFKSEYGADIPAEAVTINITKKEHEGDFTIVVFPLIKFSKKSPEQTAEALGNGFKTQTDYVGGFNVIKGFLNLSLTDAYWLKRLKEISSSQAYGTLAPNKQKVVLEYCGPNTNKPLHIGHVRNMLLGFSMSEIMKAAGYDVTKVNIYNDRGIAICQSMVAYKRYANGATPESTGIKGDHFVGDWYVKFNQVAMEEVAALPNAPEDKAEAKKLTNIHKEAVETLLKWEAGDPETIALWKQMNAWVYAGFKQTFDLIGVDFQKDYYESETYKLGKDIVDEGLSKGIFYKRKDGAVAVDLTPEGLDEKVLLRPDGTSIYITQDLATAELRHDEFGMDKLTALHATDENGYRHLQGKAYCQFLLTVNNDRYRDAADDPYSMENNWWRMKPSEPEANERIKERVLNHLRFWELIFTDAEDYEREWVSYNWFASPLVIAVNGAQLSFYKEIQRQWDCNFFDSSDAQKGYALMRKCFSKKINYLKTENKYRRSADMIHQLTDNLVNATRQD